MGSFDATASHIPLITCHGLPQVHFTKLCLQKQSKKKKLKTINPRHSSLSSFQRLQ